MQNIGRGDLAERAKLPLETIKDILNGINESPEDDDVRAIAQALCCEVDFLQEFEEVHELDEYVDLDEHPEIMIISKNKDAKLTVDQLEEIERFKQYVIEKSKNEKVTNPVIKVFI